MKTDPEHVDEWLSLPEEVLTIALAKMADVKIVYGITDSTVLRQWFDKHHNDDTYLLIEMSQMFPSEYEEAQAASWSGVVCASSLQPATHWAWQMGNTWVATALYDVFTWWEGSDFEDFKLAPCPYYMAFPQLPGELESIAFQVNGKDFRGTVRDVSFVSTGHRTLSVVSC